MQVWNLTGQRGEFETDSNGQAHGYRTFGMWSCGGWKAWPHRTPTVGDLVVIQRARNKALYQITNAAHQSTGSDQNEWWTGVMRDVVELNLLTSAMVDALKAEGLA